jgi:uncharacterized protein (UPF0147 family)
MAVKRRSTPSERVSSAPTAELHQARFAEIEETIRDIEQHYDLEIAKIQADFAIFETERRMEYERQESDFKTALSMIEDEFASLFKMLDDDMSANERKAAADLAAEDEKYLAIVRDFQTIQNEAFAKYQDLSKRAAAAIDKESEIHRLFVDGEERRFEDLRQEYASMNDGQYELLLRAMDASKNMLDQLSRDLNEQAFNDAKFLSQAILQVLENLRDTKNKVTALFKTTTSTYVTKKKKIDDLSVVRQKPHSVLNQSIVDQFVRQIDAVEKEKAAFDRLVNDELEKSKTIIGKKIIDADVRGDRAETEKGIMMYEIVIAKAKFLLKRNQRMSDLLIAKYQNEIHKINVDSFRRVEEIKLAYFMPSQFYQNSINLYSNFAFFVNEAFDEIDNMLSDFIRFNQTLTQMSAQYVQTSAKVFADFRVDLQVTTNAATQKLTELITDIDRVSTDIIQLESKNRLEIAEVKKQMENAEITGDYHKYLKGLEFDRFFADYQHDLNVKMIQAQGEEDGQLVAIERKVTAANRERRIADVDARHDRALVQLEKEIHDQALDKQFVLAEAAFRKNAALIDEEAKRRTVDIAAHIGREDLLHHAMIQERQALKDRREADGSDAVVDYVDRTQKLIDLHRVKTDADKAYLVATENRFKRAYQLEAERTEVLRALDLSFQEKTLKHRRAIDYYHHDAYVADRHLLGRADRFLAAFGRLLVDLRPETVRLQTESLGLSGFYRYEVLSTFEEARDAIAAIARKAGRDDLARKALRGIEAAFARFTIQSAPLADSAFSTGSDRKTLRTLERFYVEAIMTLRDYESVIDVFFDGIVDDAIARDVIVVENVRRATEKKKDLVDRHYDEQIWRASKRSVSDLRLGEEIEDEHRIFERTMTERVWKLNRTYEDGVAEEDRRLDYVARSLEDDMKSIRSVSKRDIARIERNRQASHRLAKIHFDRLVAAYEDLKLALHENMEAENRAIEKKLADEQAEIGRRLDSLSSSVQALPAKKQDTLTALEADKQALVVSRKKILEAELSELESLKFNARPMFVSKIQAIRERLPSDYVDLYKRMSAAEDTFVREHRNSEQAFDQAFHRFVEDQRHYEEIVTNDAVVMHPFDRQIDVADRISEKAEEAFTDSMAKAENSRDEVRKHTTDADETAKRILNV